MKHIAIVLILLLLATPVVCDKVSKFVRDENTIVCNGTEVVKANKMVDYTTISDDEKYIVFHTWATDLGDKRQGVKTYLKDIDTGKLTEIKKDARFPSISPDGKYIAYEWTPDYENVYPALYIFNIKTGEETFVQYTGGKELGWQTQEFVWDGNTVSYNTSVNGDWRVYSYTVGDKK